jgi:hypothetical protein
MMVAALGGAVELVWVVWMFVVIVDIVGGGTG